MLDPLSKYFVALFMILFQFSLPFFNDGLGSESAKRRLIVWGSRPIKMRQVTTAVHPAS
jgi:hypothetical protein